MQTNETTNLTSSSLGSSTLLRLPKVDPSRVSLPELLTICVEQGASDLHIVAGVQPVFRIDGTLYRLPCEPLSVEQTRRIVYEILTESQRGKFERELELDFSIGLERLGRFRVNLHVQRGSVAAAFRVIPSKIKSAEELRLPPAVMKLAERPRGLILVTGPTGSGKTTTLAAMIDYINANNSVHIITIEDPIEYLHPHKKSVVEQREVEADTHSFERALMYALRQDPDVIMVGEMRNLETISTALTAAETGHLVLATLHTPDAPQSVDRIIDVFPPHQQQQVRLMLSNCLEGVICQLLLPMARGKGRVPAVEVLIGTSAVQSLIREGKTHQLYSTMEASYKYGMQTFDKSLAELYRKGLISYEMAISKAHKPQDLARILAER